MALMEKKIVSAFSSPRHKTRFFILVLFFATNDQEKNKQNDEKSVSIDRRIASK